MSRCLLGQLTQEAHGSASSDQLGSGQISSGGQKLGQRFTVRNPFGAGETDAAGAWARESLRPERVVPTSSALEATSLAARLRPVGPEGPEVALRVAQREIAGAVVR